MKRKLTLCLWILILNAPQRSYAQTNSIGLKGERIINFESFSPLEQTNISEELMILSPEFVYSHPEFGKNPYDTPCEDCIELLDRRTENTRYYVKKGSLGSYFYKQTSNKDLHFKNEKNEFISIDPRLKPTDIPGIYSATQQNFSTSLNLLEGYSQLEIGGSKSIKFNKSLSIFSVNTTDGISASVPINAEYSNYTVGNDGCKINNTWNGINTEIKYEESSIKTNFILNDLSAINVNDKFTIFEDILDLPEYMHIIYDQYEGSFNANGIWEGDLLLVDQYEIEYVRFLRPVIYDSDSSEKRDSVLFNSGYKIITDGEYCKIQLFVSNDYLKDENRVFPITIDPLVFITTLWLGTIGSNYLTTCDYVVNVATPTNATLTNATIYWEVYGSVLGTCGVTAAQRCYIDKSYTRFTTSCGTSPTDPTLYWVCAGACGFYSPPVWGATTPSQPGLVTCLPPQCASYNIPFTVGLLRNACSSTPCATSCIRIQRIDVTIEGHTIEPLAVIGAIGMDTYTITDCINQTATFTASVLYGVPPYTYSWSPSGGTGMVDTDVYPLGVTVVTLTVTDACGNIITDNVTVTNPCLLPITLTSFNGYHADGMNYLHWSTSSEQNSELFIVERSFDGFSFEAIGSLPAAGNSNYAIDYSFTDTKPAASINYYRLREQDLDGTVSYSGIIAIRSEELNVNSIVLNSSNPANGELNVSIVSTTEGIGSFEIIDISGRIIYNKNIFLNNGINSIMLYPGQITAGTYILKFTKNDQFETIKFEMF